MEDSTNAAPSIGCILKGRLAFVTGAGRGNGRAIALGLAQAGAAVLVTDVDLPAVEETARVIVETGASAWAFPLDVSDSEACERLAAKISRDIGPISILINNAGVLLSGRIDEVGARDRWDRTRQINIDGPYNTAAAFLESLKSTQGCIVNVGSIQSFVGGVGAAAYIASKGAIAQLTKALAVEFARYGIRVNAIAPGLIDTAMTNAVKDNDKQMKGLLAHVPMRRMGRPEELVGAIVFLTSSDASYVTGAILPIDGGYLAV
jgi:meso-butanediol dehydrogenase/(S,S)-butanediol dehydrogenase/diacetyl reductase